MDFRTRHKVIIWTALLPLRFFWVREKWCAGWIASGQYACVRQEVPDHLLQIILMVYSLGAVVMWPKHVCFPLVERTVAPCLPVTEPFYQCSEEEDFEIPVFLIAVFKSSHSVWIVWTAIHVDLVIVLSKRQSRSFVADWLLWHASGCQVLMSKPLRGSQ